MATHKKDSRLNIRMNSQLKASVYKCAQSEGISITDFVARVLTLYVRKEELEACHAQFVNKNYKSNGVVVSDSYIKHIEKEQNED